MTIEPDIIERIEADFSADSIPTAKQLLMTSGRQGRLARCIVVASSGNVDKLRTYIETADIDPRDVIVAGEYDVDFSQLRDLRASFLIDSPQKFWIGEVASRLKDRGYIIKSLITRQATAGPFDYIADNGEGIANFSGEPHAIQIEKIDRRWLMHGDSNELENYDLNRQFEDEAEFINAVSCFILAKQSVL